MKNVYIILILCLSWTVVLRAQTTETFETETIGSTSFTDNGQVFNVTSVAPALFDIGDYPGTGWNGTAIDNRYIDNTGTGSTNFNVPVEFTVSSAGSTPFTLKSIYLYLAKSDVTLNVTGSLTITAKLGGVTKFTIVGNAPFNTSYTFQNGYTLIDFANYAGQNNANVAIDQFKIKTTGNIAYVGLDGMTWQCVAPAVAQASQTNVSCNGGSNGTATVNASGTGLTYNWTPGNPIGDGTATAIGLAAGNWTCTVTNACGLSNATTFTITQPTLITAATSQTNVSCNGGSNGVASVSVSGGAGGYSYSWSPSGGTGATASGLAAGTYTVTISDANTCSIQKNVTITQPTLITATTSQTNVSCNGGSNGVASVSASGGVGGYSYSWSPSGGTGATASGLAAGTYTVTISDASTCSIQKNVTITQPTLITATTSQTNVSCNGGSNGVASVSASGGVGAYSYSWSPSGGTGATASGLAAGTYTVTISDANTCSIQTQVIIEAAAECSIVTNWDGTSWSNGAPTCNAYAATIDGNYNTAIDGTLTACSLTINQGIVTIAGGDNLILKGALQVLGGSLTFEQNANLLQTDQVVNTGNIAYKRNSSLLYGLDHTMWSAPVHGTQTLKDFSPQTLDQHFYVYNTALNAYSNYLSASGIFGGNPNAETFVTAKGYLIRMPDGSDEINPSIVHQNFNGTPNNGTIAIGLQTQNARYNAVGNPYPSPVNIQDFLLTNQSSLADGTLYFWRKKNASTGSAYATVTLAAYVASSAEGGDTSGGAFDTGQETNWVINPAQGFLVKAAENATNLQFNNSMRRIVNNGQFFKTTGVPAAPPSSNTAAKLWLNLTNTIGDFAQTAIAYTEATTLALDYGYDGKLINDGAIALYTTVDLTKLAIQARPTFTSQDEVLLGYKASASGTYTLQLSQKTGVFAQDQPIYLKDILLNTVHNLTNDPAYTFASSAGSFEDRFVLLFAENLDTTNPEPKQNGVLVSNTNNVIKVTSSSTPIQAITIYDLSGRTVFQSGIINSATSEIRGLNATQQVLIVKVTTTDGIKISKKIIN